MVTRFAVKISGTFYDERDAIYTLSMTV